jgi:signal transduction histidine kinase
MTKAEGRGTGLGLPFVYAATRRIDGFVEVSSTINVGTTFTLWLPRALPVSIPIGAERPERR